MSPLVTDPNAFLGAEYFSARILADSMNEYGDMLTTMELVYPRFIHPEFMTHRDFSRNASSSRAIPSMQLIEQVRHAPVYPIHWGKNQPGMQASEELKGEELQYAIEQWRLAAINASHSAERLLLGTHAHKQVVNRILEPFLPIRVVVSSTRWDNFFGLRRHPDAQPEIRYLADLMFKARERSTPRLLMKGEWHLPYVTSEEVALLGIEIAIQVSVARCARVSYRLHNGRSTTVEEDQRLYQRLVGSDPKHASPAEHQATPDSCWFGGLFGRWWKNRKMHGNFNGFIQYRKTLLNERIGDK